LLLKPSARPLLLRACGSLTGRRTKRRLLSSSAAAALVYAGVAVKSSAAALPRALLGDAVCVCKRAMCSACVRDVCVAMDSGMMCAVCSATRSEMLCVFSE